MKIAKHSFVEIDYSLKLDSGDVVDQSEPNNPLGFVYDLGQVIPGLEEKLKGMETGYETEFTLEPEEGYGPHDPQLMHEIDKSAFPPDQDVQAGMAFIMQTPHGSTQVLVRDVQDDKVTIDLNHPLAGERLHFKVKVVGVREATEDEIADAGSCEGCCEDHCHGH